MPGSCSSTDNACAACAPNLSIFSISALTTQNKVGHGCLNGDPSNDPFALKIGSGGRTYNAADNVICEIIRSNISYSHKEFYSYIVDEFGIIAIGINASILMSYYQFAKDGCDLPYSSTTESGYIYTSKAKNNSCEEDVVYSDGTLGNIPGNLYCEPNDDPDYPGCSENCNRNDSCTTSISEYANQCAAETNVSGFMYWANSSLSEFVKFSLSDIKNLSFFYDLCKISVDTRMSVLESNAPQDCNGSNCGEGADACWGSAVGFSIANNNLDDPNANSTTAQRLKFKIAIPKDGFDKKYQSISGRVFFYIPSEEDIEQDRTPCCNDDFTGDIVKQSGYSISAGSIFKDNYFAVDCGEFNNNDQTFAGETISICSTVDNITFV